SAAGSAGVVPSACGVQPSARSPAGVVPSSAGLPPPSVAAEGVESAVSKSGLLRCLPAVVDNKYNQELLLQLAHQTSTSSLVESLRGESELPPLHAMSSRSVSTRDDGVEFFPDALNSRDACVLREEE
ncbi:unnamed protein product, partial [Scytosiphon promiscuus]